MKIGKAGKFAADLCLIERQEPGQCARSYTGWGLERVMRGRSRWRASETRRAATARQPWPFTGSSPSCRSGVGARVVALGAIGAFTSLLNGRGPAFSAARHVVLGCLAAAITYGVGRALGVSLS